MSHIRAARARTHVHEHTCTSPRASTCRQSARAHVTSGDVNERKACNKRNGCRDALHWSHYIAGCVSNTTENWMVRGTSPAYLLVKNIPRGKLISRRKGGSKNFTQRLYAKVTERPIFSENDHDFFSFWPTDSFSPKKDCLWTRAPNGATPFAWMLLTIFYFEVEGLAKCCLERNSQNLTFFVWKSICSLNFSVIPVILLIPSGTRKFHTPYSL